MKYTNTKVLFMAIVLLVPGLSVAGNSLVNTKYADEINFARENASKYYNIETALQEGYEQLFECTVDATGKRAMGVHFINTAYAGDGKLRLDQPDVLMYEPQQNGSMQLVAMEYIVFEKDLQGKSQPEFFGRKLTRKSAVGVHPVDPFFEIHLWNWRHNPAGLFADWNALASCEYDSK